MTFVRFRLSRRALWAVSTLALVLLASLAFVLEEQVLGFSFVFALLSILPLLDPVERIQMDPFRPHLGLSALLFLYSISTLIFVTSNNVTYYGEQASERNIFIYSMACLLCMAGISCGTLMTNLFRSNKQDITFLPRWVPDRVKIYKIASVLGLIFSPFIIYKFQPWGATSYADVALSLRVEHLSDETAGIKEIFFENIPSTLILAACTFAIFDRGLHTLIRLIAGLLLLAYITTSLLSGWRGQLTFVVLIIVIYFHWKIKAIKIQYLIGAAFMGYVLINTLSIARVSSNPMEMIAAVLENFDNTGLLFLAISQSGELATSTNLLRLISGIESGESQFGYGSILFNQVSAFIPRALLPDRPPIGSELFVQTFYPGVFESGGGYGFFLPQDGYWDFGLTGVFFYSLFLGMLLESLYIWFSNRRQIDFNVLLYAVLYSQLVLAIVRSGTIGSLKAALIASIPLFIIWLSYTIVRLCSGLQVGPNRYLGIKR
jgi:oligosaccharide repeat unit polymerase